MKNEKAIFLNLSLNLFLIPKTPLASRQEEWAYTIESTYKYDFADLGLDLGLGRATHLYYSKGLKAKLEKEVKIIENNTEFKNVQLIHETSYSGMPYQVYAESEYQGVPLKIYFDGLIFFMTVARNDCIQTINELIDLTSSEVEFRNHCFHIIKSYGFEVFVMRDAFWDAEISSIDDIKLSTESEYPAFKIVCNDKNFVRFTNLGDKQISESGMDYFLYLAENKKYIRDRICHEYVMYHDLNFLIDFFNEKDNFAIEASTLLINSIKDMPGSVLTFFRRTKSWKTLRSIPSNLIDLESSISKYHKYVENLVNELDNRYSYINVPKTIWLSGEETDNKLEIQREVPNFYFFKYDKGKIVIDDPLPIKPTYSCLSRKINEKCDNLKKDLEIAIASLNNATSIYSTSFGFDALWIAIIAILITLISIMIDIFK
jgi:hypothetical protein